MSEKVRRIWGKDLSRSDWRGLAARAPYFHNGAAATLDEVVDFYNLRFQMNLTPRQKRDLVNFLKTL